MYEMLVLRYIFEVSTPAPTVSRISVAPSDALVTFFSKMSVTFNTPFCSLMLLTSSSAPEAPTSPWVTVTL